MKTIFLLCVTVGLMGFGCAPQADLALGQSWSQGCVSLRPDGQTYRLEGTCCEYVRFPLVRLEKGRSFSVNGTYHTFTGAGFAGSPTVVHGEVSSDGTALRLAYSVNSRISAYKLQPGYATVFCYCGCN